MIKKLLKFIYKQPAVDKELEHLPNLAPADTEEIPFSDDKQSLLNNCKAKHWQNNPPDEQREIASLFKSCLEQELFDIGIAVMHLALDEIKESEKNPYGVFCVHRTMFKRIVKYGHELDEDDPSHVSPEYDTYKDLMSYDLLRIIQDTQADYEVLAGGVLCYFTCSRMDAKTFHLLKMALEECIKQKEKSIYNQITLPKLPEPEIDFEAIKEKDISEKIAEAKAKGVKDILISAEDLELDEIDRFTNTYGSKHLLSFSDGTFVGIVTNKKNGQPRRNLLGLRPESLKFIDDETEDND